MTHEPTGDGDLIQTYAVDDPAFRPQPTRLWLSLFLLLVVFGVFAAVWPGWMVELASILGFVYVLFLFMAMLNKLTIRSMLKRQLPLELIVHPLTRRVSLSCPSKTGEFAFEKCRWYLDRCRNTGPIGWQMPNRHMVVMQVEEVLIPCGGDEESVADWVERLREARCPRLPNDPSALRSWSVFLLILCITAACVFLGTVIGMGLAEFGHAPRNFQGICGVTFGLAGLVGAIGAMGWDRLEGAVRFLFGAVKLAVMVVFFSISSKLGLLQPPRCFCWSRCRLRWAMQSPDTAPARSIPRRCATDDFTWRGQQRMDEETLTPNPSPTEYGGRGGPDRPSTSPLPCTPPLPRRQSLADPRLRAVFPPRKPSIMTDPHDLIRDLRKENGSKIVLLVSDGLGGLPLEPGGKTELETAKTPHLDALARRGTLGLSTPVLPGIAPGSGPGHLGLFGYDPLKFKIGRGVLEALGIDFALGPNDVAIRGNFCTIDAKGDITDRRAGRIGSDIGAKLCTKLSQIKIPGVEVFVRPVKEYRLVIVFRAEGLGGNVEDTDPQATGVPPLSAVARTDCSQRTAEIANEFLRQAREILKNDAPANFLTLRGIDKLPSIPTFQDVYGLRAGAIAVYPMYRGLARLVSMDVLDAGQTLSDQMTRLEAAWNDYDFFFIHFKYTDSTGEDGNFAAKVQKTEELDTCIPRINALKPTVLIVTGDHSTPAKLKSHSWHPVPTLLAADTCRFDGSTEFGEAACLRGGLGQFEAKHLMLLAMAHAGRLDKYGA